MPRSNQLATTKKNYGGLGGLISQVFEKDRCAVCGACVGHCPYPVHHEGRVIIRDRCTLDEGRCYEFCPMAGAYGRFDGELGPVRRILVAQAARPDLRKKAQYGGVVSALTNLALELGLVREAVLTSGHPENPPYGVRVKTRSDVKASAGSRFTASGAVAALNQALSEPDNHPLAFIGTPCQIKAAAAMRKADPKGVSYNPQRIELLIGLFCTWALDYRKLSAYLRLMLFGERAFRYDIPPPPADVFKVYTGDGIKAFPLEEILPLRLNACRFCDDMTSVQADVSVGALEGMDEWNTVIVRTQAGEKLIELAQEMKAIKINRLPDEDLEHLKSAAAGKKERGIIAWTSEG